MPTPDDVIDRVAASSAPPKLADDELARVRAYLEAPMRLSALQADPAERDRRRRLKEIVAYNDELRTTPATGTRFETGIVEIKSDVVNVHAGATQTRGTIGGDTDWRDVQHRLLALYERGDAYTSIGDLAKRIGCAKATIQKAIQDSAKLKGWQARHTKAKGPPRASSLSEIVMDNTAQSREPDPAENAEACDDDAIFARLIQEAATPEERAELNGLPLDKRRELVELIRNDPDRNTRIRGRTP